MDDQEIFHDAIESASENFNENHIVSQIDHDVSEVDHNDSEEKNHFVDKLIKNFNQKIAKCQNLNTFEEKNNEFNEQIKVLNEKNDDAQTKVFQEQLKVKHVVIDTHVECQAQYAKLEEERYEHMIRYSALCDNDKQHRKKIDEQEMLFDKMSRQLVEMNNNVLRLQEKILEKETKFLELEECVRNKDLEIEKCLERLNDCDNKLHKIEKTHKTIHMVMPSKDKLYNGQKRIGFENPTYFCKAKGLRPSLYDERVIGLGYTLMFITHSNEVLEIEKFKRARENKIEFAYDYGNRNASYVNEKINFLDDYFQDIINPDFDKIDSPFHVRRPKYIGVIWKKKGSSNTSNVDISSVSISKLNKDVKRYSLKDLLSCNNSHHVDTKSAYACNDAMNVFCNSRLYSSCDVNDLFVFDDVSIRKSQVSKMPFRKKPRDSLNVRSKSNSNKSLPRTVYRWLPKLQQLAELVAKWIPKVKPQIDKISKTPNSSGPIFKWVPKVSLMSLVFYLFQIVQICLWIIDLGCSKHMTGNRALLTNFVEKFRETVLFGNNDFTEIVGYRDVVIRSMMIKKVYYVKDLLTDDRSSNLYTIALNKITSNSSACSLAKASSSQSWLWHQRLSHLNFATINNLVKNNLVRGLPKIKFEKDHLCSACEQGKIHQIHHKSKTAFASNKPLYLLHMDLCGPIRVESINRKRYVLVVVDDYSRYTWVFFLHSKDKASEVIISFIKKTQVNLQLQNATAKWCRGKEESNLSQSCKNYAYIKVYVGQPPSFVSKQYPDHVYALDKALYGLKQAPRACRIVYNSTAESEYVVVSGCCAQVLWMRTQLTDYGFFYDKVPIYSDSKSAIAISCNPVHHTRTKHIDVRYHFIKDHVEKGTIELYFVGNEYQLADLFKKSLPEARFKFLVKKLGMMSHEK
nr:hypothetical protein [Tanacetum cinerariifolium]